MRRFYERHTDDVNEWHKAWYAKHAAAQRARKRVEYWANPERQRARMKRRSADPLTAAQRRENNRLAVKRYKAKNRDLIARRRRERSEAAKAGP